MNMQRVPNLDWPRHLFSAVQAEPGVNQWRPKLTPEAANVTTCRGGQTPVTRYFHRGDTRQADRPCPML